MSPTPTVAPFSHVLEPAGRVEPASQSVRSFRRFLTCLGLWGPKLTEQQQEQQKPGGGRRAACRSWAGRGPPWGVTAGGLRGDGARRPRSQARTRAQVRGLRARGPSPEQGSHRMSTAAAVSAARPPGTAGSMGECRLLSILQMANKILRFPLKNKAFQTQAAGYNFQP